MEIPVRLAKAAREAGVSHCSVVTSVGSNSNSWFLYTKTKGQLEDQVRAMGFPYTTIFRPGLLERNDPENSRFFEKLASKFRTLQSIIMYLLPSILDNLQLLSSKACQ